ncbi:MAG: 16S rRNA (cytidine(1402)-2'-O)-methyltransferase [Oscillospiraceae bacterium]|nr:16S rRNA (cytidine(1402)-2'-O)-methyltransferase [Oscillospiraceae bacterium]
MAKLYLVGTPIGNLGDFSPRAIDTLKSVDFIAAEDTRVTLKLLNRFEIEKPMVSYYQHNMRERGEIVLSRILSGEDCALVTDAGMPAISDPGEELVKLCAEAGVEVVAVPGPTAAATALALSALPSGRFTFEGFLSVSKSERRAHLDLLKNERRTMIFYEAPHKLTNTLKDLCAAFGGERRISLCRELTKLHEEVIRTTIAEAMERFELSAPRGEFVLVVEGAPEQQKEESTPEQAAELARRLMADGMSASAAAKEAAAMTGLKKSDIYRLLQQ